jgi:hypothetical protein
VLPVTMAFFSIPGLYLRLQYSVVAPLRLALLFYSGVCFPYLLSLVFIRDRLIAFSQVEPNSSDLRQIPDTLPPCTINVTHAAQEVAIV